MLTGAKIRFFLDMSKCRNKNAPLSGKILVGSLSRRYVLSVIVRARVCACVMLHKKSPLLLREMDLKKFT